MPTTEPITPTRHRAIFTYRNKQIPFYFWVKEAEDTKPDTVLFLGTGQIGKIPRWVAESLPAGVVVVQGLPHWHSHPSGNDLVDFAKAFALCAYKAIQRDFGVDSLNLVGTSQGTPSTIWLGNKLAGKVGNITLLLPMGLTVAQFGDTDMARFRELRRRSLRTLLQSQQSALHDPRNVYTAGILMAIIIAGLFDRSTVNKYTAGLSHDMLEDFRLLAANQVKHHRHLALFLGEQDKVFPPEEVRQSLQEAGLDGVHIEIIPGLTHASPALRTAKNYWSRIADQIRQKA